MWRNQKMLIRVLLLGSLLFVSPLAGAQQDTADTDKPVSHKPAIPCSKVFLPESGAGNDPLRCPPNTPPRSVSNCQNQGDEIQKVEVGQIIDWCLQDERSVLPPNFQLCDGSAITTGPLNGKTTPACTPSQPDQRYPRWVKLIRILP